MRADLFTVVHELFETDTARYADILLPATSQLEHVDLHKPYGHLSLQYNMPAIAPLGEAKSNWDVMRALAASMGFDDAWLKEDANEVIRSVLEATAQSNPLLAGITLERLQVEGSIPLTIPAEQQVRGDEEVRASHAAERVRIIQEFAAHTADALWEKNLHNVLPIHVCRYCALRRIIL